MHGETLIENETDIDFLFALKNSQKGFTWSESEWPLSGGDYINLI